MGDAVLGNRYEILEKIGDGGMAFVYKAKDKSLNREVAVKVLRPEFVDDEEFLAKFKREAEAVASLSHPNIVNVYDVGEDGKVHYIVMEYVDGRNLKDIVKNEGKLDLYTSLDITKQIALGLGAAHRKRIIHRDIKPHNILISNDGLVKVADFGIAKAASNSTITNIGSIIGSVHYFSPEQAKGKYVNNTTDLYSLGIVLYEMLLGKIPFKGDSPVSIALQHINEVIEFSQEEKLEIPQSVRTIIRKLTAKSSGDRYQSAYELIEDIEYIEKNIDLDFIKEYDNYATQKLDTNVINELNSKSKAYKPIIEEDEEEIEDSIYGNPDDLIDGDIMDNKKSTKRSEKRKKKQEDPKKKKLLITAAVILGLILIFEVFTLGKFFLGGNIGRGQLTAPDFTNISLEDAQKQADELGIKIEIRRDEYNPDFPKDYIISQTPTPGSEIKKGDIIKVVISRGGKQVAVPNVEGLSLDEAERIIKDSSLNIGTIKYQESERYKSNVVISQTPYSGEVDQGSKIDLIVSKGPKVEEKPEIVVPEVPKNPGTTNPGTTDPGTTDPGTTDPGTTDPGTTDPGTTDPGTTDPGTKPGTKPGTTQQTPTQ